MKSRSRIVSLELVRIVSCIGVLICHFNSSVCGWNNGLIYPQNCIIPSWYFEGRLYTGDVGVSMFFMLSGATLMLTYKPNNLGLYYKKRFLAIYPMFWIAWFAATSFDFMYFKGMSSANGVWLWTSLLGMDGYLGMHGIGAAGSFYKVGEWFLGCILLIYLVFPLVHYCVEKRPFVTLIGTSILSLLFMNGINVGVYRINSYSFFVRIPEIILGMMFIKYNMREKPRLLLSVSGICALFAILTRRWIPSLLFCIAICMFLFSALIFLGEKISNETIKTLLANIGVLTFPIFLVHHWLSDRIVMGFSLDSMSKRIVFFMCILWLVLVLLLSKSLVWGSGKILSYIPKPLKGARARERNFMRKISKGTLICILVFVVMPLTYLLKTVLVDPLVDNNGVEVSSSLHCELVDQHMDGNTIVVTMKNTGESVWSEQDQIRCTIFLNGEDIGWRVTLQQDQTVMPGDSAEFCFYAVKSQLNETAEIVMLQETVAYFPERFSVKMPALTDLHVELIDQRMDGDSLVVELRNTGSSPWQEADWVRCTLFVNGEDSGIRVKLQPDQIIEPGQTAQFQFDNVRDMLNETAEIVMLQETVTYFEERFPVE